MEEEEGIYGFWLGRRGLLYLSFYLSKLGSLKQSHPWWQHHQMVKKQSPEPRIPFPRELLQGGFSHQPCSSRKRGWGWRILSSQMGNGLKSPLSVQSLV